MKPTFLALLLIHALVTTFAQKLPDELQTPSIVSVNRMPMRASAFAYENLALAKQREKEKSAYFQSLNGSWKFNWVKDPRQRPQEFYRTDFDDSKWVNFKVPANWELHGYGLPIYVNQAYEFAGKKITGPDLHPPFDIPVDNNPVGSYRKKFILPKNWDGREVFIHLGAVKSAFFIWVNGIKVGYSEDSKLAAEFDISKYLQPGENLIALQVYRWSDGSYLECQDMWRISGIERDIYLYATPILDVRDFKSIANLDNTYKKGLLAVTTEINSYKIEHNTNHSKADTFSVSLNLVAPNGKSVYSERSNGVKTVLGNYKSTISFSTTVDDVLVWSAEIPNLYTLYVSLFDQNGQLLEVIPQRIGFRSVEIMGSNLLVNGQRIFIKGVNRHEHDPKEGHTLSHEDMRKDMEMMKKLNINAVRNSHYPPDPYWMELCDEYGLYVIDEANIESHGRHYDLSFNLGNDKQWRIPHLERIQRMYQRDKNHPSIITWSLGNEAGNGVNFYEGYDWLKSNDGRPVQYERAEYDYNTDMIVPQYLDPESLEKYAGSKPTRPLILSEYAHIMGNSLGNFKDYWDVIESKPGLQGGFIWEWIDQAIDTVKNGKRIMAYGGDFPLSGPVNEDFSDNNFCAKGLVTSYRKMTPMAVEAKKVYQYIKTTYNHHNKISIRNSYFFKKLDNIQLTWELLEDGKVVEKGGSPTLTIEPQTSKELSLPIRTKAKSDSEYFLNVYYKLKNEETFLPAGSLVAEEQFLWKGQYKIYQHAISTDPINVKNTAGSIKIAGRNFQVSFDTKKGTMNNYIFKGINYIKNGPVPNFWRAPTDNDIGSKLNVILRDWRTAYQDGEMILCNSSQSSDGTSTITFKKIIIGGNALIEQTFVTYNDGVIKVSVKMAPVKGEYPLILRIGTNLEINKNFRQVSYYGRGPGESYWDRKSASMIGLYRQDVDSQYFKYIRPQESGNKTDVKWLNLQDGNNKGLRIVMADSLLNFSALPYSIDVLDPNVDKKQFHSGELKKQNYIFLNVDLKQSGLAGIDSWSSMPLEKYRIPFSIHQYSYWILPI